MPICSVTGKTFTISEAEINYCHQHNIPLPIISPLERLRRTCAFLSSIHLYQTKCGLTGKDILTFIPPHKGLVVYDIDAWMSDDWDPMAYGQEYDFSRPFFEQMAELLKKAPLPSLECIRSSMENSDYTNGVLNVKNCYLAFGIMNAQDVLFSRTVTDSKDILDSIYVSDSELGFGCILVKNCYNVRYLENCSNCSDSAFLYDCHNCKHCFQCTNLINREYCINNKQLTKEEYDAYLTKIDVGSFDEVEKQKQLFYELKTQAAVKYMQGKNNEHSSGNQLENTKNCQNCLFVSNAEDIEWCIQMFYNTKDTFVTDGFGQNGQYLYYSSAVGENAYNIKFCFDCYGNVRDLEYCIFVGLGSTDCFGCIGLKKKQYCILNKQYTKEEYFALLQKIKTHMLSTGEYGQFFPAVMSPMDYNRSEAQVFMPLTRFEAEKLGYTWKEDVVEDFTQTYQIPDHIKDAQDDILDAVLKCSKTGKKYKIIKQELAAYRAHNIPIPRISPIARLESLQSSLTMSEALPKHCTKCHKDILTVYDTEQWRVLCEECYQNEVH